MQNRSLSSGTHLALPGNRRPIPPASRPAVPYRMSATDSLSAYDGIQKACSRQPFYIRLFTEGLPPADAGPLRI